MSANVIDFKRREPEVPHITGAALCLDCKHEWVAEIEQQMFEETDGWMECPACHLERGRMKYKHSPERGTLVWTCNCGNDLFHVLREGVHCPNCGRLQEFP